MNNKFIIVEKGFKDIILGKKNCLEIERTILNFITNRKENQYLAIDISTDFFKDKTIFLYMEMKEDGTVTIIDSKRMD